MTVVHNFFQKAISYYYACIMTSRGMYTFTAVISLSKT